MTETAPPPKVKAPALAVLFATVFINLVGFGLVVPLLPFFAQTLNASAKVGRCALSLPACAAMVVSVIAGPQARVFVDGQLCVSAVASRHQR